MRKTNIEIITDVMEYSKHGALMQMFVMDALAKWADHVSTRPDADFLPPIWNGDLIHGPAWKACAIELKERLDKGYKEDEPADGTFALPQPTSDDDMYIANTFPTGVTNEHFQTIVEQRAVVRTVIQTALAAGFAISMHDGSVWAERNSQDFDTLMRAIMSTEGDTIYIKEETAVSGTWKNVASVSFLYDNNSWEVIHDTSIAEDVPGYAPIKAGENLQENLSAYYN